MNSQILPRRRPAMAALLMVLSASTALAQVTNVQIKGSFDGRDGGVVQDGILQASMTANGTASRIGRFTLTLKATVDLATGLSRGTCQLVVANGDLINCSFVGRGGPTETTNVGHIVELMTITGGFGRFLGATGNLKLDRLLDESTLPAFGWTSGTLTGAITLPGPAK